MELMYEIGNSGWELGTNIFTHSGKIKGDRRYSQKMNRYNMFCLPVPTLINL
jgi:hypothetical protein